MIFPMSNKIFFTAFLVSFFWLCGCTKAQIPEKPDQTAKTEKEKPQKIEKIKNPGKVIHVLVALCDNENQGIVPVPAHLGDGADANKNLYWGAAYGVKTFFSKSANWEKTASFDNPKENVLQRIVFKHKRENIYLVADAYDGSRMKQTINDFFGAVSGNKLENIEADNETLQIFGSANLVAFVGHNGLMDFDLENEPTKKDEENRDAVILACASRNYFSAPLKKTGANPILWTSNLMAPEAYILHDALEGWIAGETNEQIQTRAAKAYAKYQKISVKSASRLLVTGW
jgi:hypothetical protein